MTPSELNEIFVVRDNGDCDMLMCVSWSMGVSAGAKMRAIIENCRPWKMLASSKAIVFFHAGCWQVYTLSQEPVSTHDDRDAALMWAGLML